MFWLQTLVNKWKIHAFNKLEDIQPEYVMKGNIPKKISPGTVKQRSFFEFLTALSLPLCLVV